MNKQTFLNELQARLYGLPREDIAERLTFYSEIIDDRMEEGLTEEQAIAQIGTTDEVVAQILTEFSLPRIVKERVRPRRHLRAWEIVLLVLGSPVWLPLLLAALSVLLAVYVTVWSLLLSLWAVEAALGVCALGGAVWTVVFAGRGDPVAGVAMLGMAMVCAGLCIFLFYGCRAATRGTAALTGKTALGIKSLFVGKEDAA